METLGKSGVSTLISAIVGSIFLILSAWLLHTVGVHRIPPKFNTPEAYNQWETQRRHLLHWGSTAAIGVSVGIFQLTFGLIYILHLIYETYDDNGRIWNLANVILHIIFFVALLSSFGLTIRAYSETQDQESGLKVTFLVAEVIELMFLLLHLYIYEMEHEYAKNICQCFTLDEVKDHFGKFLTRIRTLSHPRQGQVSHHRLIEETVSVPV